jgi:hypothetical protein
VSATGTSHLYAVTFISQRKYLKKPIRIICIKRYYYFFKEMSSGEQADPCIRISRWRQHKGIGSMESYKDATAWMYPAIAKTVFDVAPAVWAEMNQAIPGFEQWGIKRSGMEHSLIWPDKFEKNLYISPTALASLWCLAYLTFSLHDSNSVQRQTHYGVNKQSLDQFWLPEDTARYCDFIQAAFDSYFSIEGGWPAFLARPHCSDDLSCDIGRVNNIFRGAVSWWVLQVINEAHLYVTDDIRLTDATQRQAITDKFATRWIMQSAGVGLDKSLRVPSVLVAQMWSTLRVLEFGESSADASTVTRLHTAVSMFGPDERSQALEILSNVFIPVLLPEAAAASHKFTSLETGFDFVCEKLQEKIDVAALAVAD